MSRSGTKNKCIRTARTGEEAPIVVRISRERGIRKGKGNRGIPGALGSARRKNLRKSRRSDSRQGIYQRREPER